MVAVNERFKAIESNIVKNDNPGCLADVVGTEPILRLTFILRESTRPPKAEKDLVISGLNPDRLVDEKRVRYLADSLCAWDRDNALTVWSNIYDLVEILKQLQQYRAQPDYITLFIGKLANLGRILERIVDTNRESMPSDRESMEVLDGIRRSIAVTTQYWKSARFNPPTIINQNINAMAGLHREGQVSYNPKVPPPSHGSKREEDYLQTFLSDDYRTSSRSARSLLKDVAQMATIRGRLETDPEFFNMTWPKGFEVDDRNASMITMKEAKEYFTENKFSGDPIEYMDFVAHYIGSTHNNRLLSIQEKSNVCWISFQRIQKQTSLETRA